MTLLLTAVEICLWLKPVTIDFCLAKKFRFRENFQMHEINKNLINIQIAETFKTVAYRF